MTEPTTSPVSERTAGPTPNGGAYAIAYFRDAKGAPCPKAEAAGIEVIEFDASDKAVFRTYLQLGDTPVPI